MAFGSPSFRAIGRPPETLTDAELIDLILGQPRMLRRPILDLGDRVLVGAAAVESTAES